MSSSQTNNSFDPYEKIYFKDFLKNGVQKDGNIKEILLIVMCHLCAIGVGTGTYWLLRNNISLDRPANNTVSETSNIDSPKSYGLIVSKTSVKLDLDETETTTLDVSVDNPEKSFSLHYDYSKVISIEEVSNSNGTVTYNLIPQSIGTGYIEFKLIDSDDENKVYDTKRIEVNVDGTSNYGEYNSHAYQVYEDAMTWEEAKEACEQLGGHLATISSSEEQSYIERIIKSTKKENLWIGGSYSISNGTWSWVDGSEWNYTNWDMSQPDNYTSDEYYLRIKNRDKSYDDWEAYDGKWNDTANSADGTDQSSDVPISSFGYICEWDSIQNIEWAVLYKNYLTELVNDVKYSSAAEFDLVFIDEDDTPELIISTGSSHVDTVMLYTINDGKVVECGNLGDSGSFSYYEKNNKIWTSYYTNGDGGIFNSIESINEGELLTSITLHECYPPSLDGAAFYEINGQEVSAEEYNSKFNEYFDAEKGNYTNWTYTYNDNEHRHLIESDINSITNDQ